ncbi:serine/threonine-protein phosphatase 4 regulatory subunit 3 [Ditylenchus destructor]|nr:serine/threonine-protein phosphatase 4 regulatory subunit 3 [Ditylenchus destructor]
MCSIESAQANVMKTSEKSKPLVDENPVAENEAGKGKPALDRIDFVRDAHNRVTLYKHNNNNHSYVWEVRGRGHVACVQSRNQPKAWSIVVRCESEEKNVLESRILRDTIYQKQHGIRLVWTAPDVSKLALRFQEKVGCTEVWDKICQIQGKDPEVEDGSILATTEALKQQMDKSKVEAEAAHIRVNDLEESIRELERKHQNSEDQLRNLEQELSNSQELIKFIEKKSESLKSQEVSRLQDSLEAKNYEIALLKLALETMNSELQTERKLRFDIAERFKKKDAEATNLSDRLAKSNRYCCDVHKRLTRAEERHEIVLKEYGKVKQELCDTNQRLEAAEKQNAETIKEKEIMAEELAQWQRYRRKIGRAAQFGDGIGKENQEPTNLQLELANLSPLRPALSPAAWKRQSGSNGDSAKRARINTEKMPEEAGAKNAANVASRSFDNVL